MTAHDTTAPSQPLPEPRRAGGPPAPAAGPETGPEHGQVAPTTWSLLRPLVLRLHFYAGVLVAPFILVAAVTGGLYAVAPQVEQVVYAHELHVEPAATAVPLADQVAAALAARGTGSEADLLAVRPAPTPSDTTRVLFSDPSLRESYRQAVFVDPGTGAVVGQLPVYGTSGAMPLRAWLSELHRNLHLGEPGRLYSELAASWLSVLALSGLALWATRRLRSGRAAERARRTLLLERGLTGRVRTRGLHAVTGTWMLLGLLALSATGLTWSTFAGERVTALREALSWTTPTVDTTLPGTAAAGGEMSGHEGHAPGMVVPGPAASTAPTAEELPGDVTAVLEAARGAGLTAGLVEVRLPAEPGAAWKVDEVDRSWPEQVDSAAVAVTPGGEGAAPTATVLDVVRFSDHPFMAKMARWGVDAHSGSLFGLANQLVLLALAAGITASVVWGYRMWWQRRPDRASRLGVGRPVPRGAWRRLPLPVLAAVVVVAAAVGWAAPVLGVSLLAFLALDALLGLRGGVTARN